MSIREVDVKQSQDFNRLATHPLQAWEWGEFRLKEGIEVIRLGRYQDNKLKETAQVTIHPIPFTFWKVGYFPKGGQPSKELLDKLYQIGVEKNCIFIKLEPNVEKENWKPAANKLKIDLRKSPHPLFPKYTFRLNLDQTEEELLKKMHPKTRYNIKVAQKKGVKIKEDNTDNAFDIYLRLTQATTKRQKFFSHSLLYHKLMWETLKPAGIAHLLTANYLHDNKTYTLVTWVLFLFNGVVYYPYGASSTKFRNTMASNLIMWEAISFAKINGAKTFDMWGSLGPDASPQDPWFGFHKFKQGYNPELVEFIGSYDLIVNPKAYRLYNLIHALREVYLKLKSNLPNR